MDLSKGYDCSLHDLQMAKLETYCLDMVSLSLLKCCLTKRKQKLKVQSSFSDLLEFISEIS